MYTFHTYPEFHTLHAGRYPPTLLHLHESLTTERRSVPGVGNGKMAVVASARRHIYIIVQSTGGMHARSSLEWLLELLGC